uniref:HMA domain-containing protein n=1 Tax=Kalanchoe fedtschenkoi TaxID=63787 RepID=A0A7N0V377_KALFE
MGILGTVDYLKDVLRGAKKPKKLKQFKTAAFKIRMDCDGCVRRAKNTLQKMKGVKSVDIDRKLQKVTVSGYIEGPKLLKRFTDKTKMRAQIWPYVPFQTVPDPHTSLAYDKKAPPNHVKRADPSATTKETTLDPQFLTMFSDDNTNACTIM